MNRRSFITQLLGSTALTGTITLGTGSAAVASAPGAPSAPSAASAPSSPSAPSAPSTPSAPSSPSAPSVPSSPSKPSGPDDYLEDDNATDITARDNLIDNIQSQLEDDGLQTVSSNNLDEVLRAFE